MSKHESKTDETDGRIGKSPDEVDAKQPGDEEIANHLGFEIESESDTTDAMDNGHAPRHDRDELAAMLHDLAERVETLERERDELAERVETLEDELENAEDIRKDLAKNATKAADEAEKARVIAQNANDRVNEELDGSDETDESAALPGGVEPSTSPLDFFANCRSANVKHLMTEEQNEKNRFRALRLAKRWPEFGRKSRNGKKVMFKREDVRQGLTAILGKDPHGTTVTRVWDELESLGGSDLKEKRRCLNPESGGEKTQHKETVLVMTVETADGLHDSRYESLNLLDTGGEMALGGGVTPVVTGETDAPA